MAVDTIRGGWYTPASVGIVLPWRIHASVFYSVAVMLQRQRRAEQVDSDQAHGKYNEYYYNHCCGTPYVRGGAIWDFFSVVADRVVSGLAPHTVLDAGCAKGFLVEMLRRKGVAAWGFDISEYAISEVAPDIRAYCRVGSVTDTLERDYDLIVCQEILEHVTPEQAEQAIRNLCMHTSTVLFSSCPSDFTEPTHINVHPTEYWVGEFARCGFRHDEHFDASFIAPWAVLFRRVQDVSVQNPCSADISSGG
jgi:O-antigen biosynthesis protein